MNIEQLAREAGAQYAENFNRANNPIWLASPEELTRFAALVRAQALEDATKQLDGLTVGRNELIGPAGRYAKGSAMDAAMRQCAAAIRALQK